MVKRRKKRSGSTMIMVAIIIAINLAGINYAQWNGEMRVTANVSTGTIDAQIVDFIISSDGDSDGDGDSNGEEINPFRRLLVRNISKGLKGSKVIGSKDGSNISIVGTMQEGQTATVTYSVKNLGTLPVKFGTPKVVENNSLDFDLTSAVKDVDGKNGGIGQFEITACEAGDYSFTVELPYSLDVQ